MFGPYTIIHTAKSIKTPSMGIYAFLKLNGFKVTEDRKETLICAPIKGISEDVPKTLVLCIANGFLRLEDRQGRPVFPCGIPSLEEEPDNVRPSLPKFHDITIVLAGCPELVFTGRYCRELEAKNWHYYEREDGIMIHLRKDGKGFIIGDTYNNVKGASNNEN